MSFQWTVILVKIKMGFKDIIDKHISRLKNLGKVQRNRIKLTLKPDNL